MATKHKWTEEIPTALDKATERTLREIGIMISGDAITQVPVDTGRLRGSITYATAQEQSDISGDAKAKDKIRKPRSKCEVWTDTNVEYSQHVEYGTRHMAAQPYLRPAFDSNRKKMPKEYSAEITKAFKGK